MHRKTLLVILALVAFMGWTTAWISISKAEDGREPGDPRTPTFQGSYTGRTMGPYTGANSWGFSGPGISIGTPKDTPMIDWKALHLKRIAEVAEAKIENIEFAFDESVIEEQYFGDLDEVALLLFNNPEITLTLSGHTDLVGTEAYNDALSDRRSSAMEAALRERGVPAESLTCVGFGESQPLEAVATELRKNRRVEVDVTIELPVYLD